MSVDDLIEKWRRQGVEITETTPNPAALPSQPLGRQAAAGLTEAQFTKVVAGLARDRGWKVRHVRPGRKRTGVGGKDKFVTPEAFDGAGFPDLFMVHPATGRRLAPELKVGKNHRRKRQRLWKEWLEACGIESPTWRPRDMQTILKVLT